MNPYLEHRTLWPDVHNRLITSLADTITPLVAPNFYVGVESRTYLIKPEGDMFLGISPAGALPGQGAAGSADDVAVLEVELPIGEEVSHYYLEVHSVRTDELVTAIELLSPVNKIDSHGRFEYEQKRYKVLMSRTNYVEIDLLRAGEPMPVSKPVQSDYRILVSRGWTRGKAHLYAFNLPVPIPSFPLPLMPGDEEPLVPLNEIVHTLYVRARFDLRIDYSQPPPPPLSDTQGEWISQILAA